MVHRNAGPWLNLTIPAAMAAASRLLSRGKSMFSPVGHGAPVRWLAQLCFQLLNHGVQNRQGLVVSATAGIKDALAQVVNHGLNPGPFVVGVPIDWLLPRVHARRRVAHGVSNGGRSPRLGFTLTGSVGPLSSTSSQKRGGRHSPANSTCQTRSTWGIQWGTGPRLGLAEVMGPPFGVGHVVCNHRVTGDGGAIGTGAADFAGLAVLLHCPKHALPSVGKDHAKHGQANGNTGAEDEGLSAPKAVDGIEDDSKVRYFHGVSSGARGPGGWFYLGKLGDAWHAHIVAEPDAPRAAGVERQAVAGQGPVNLTNARLNHGRADLRQGRVHVVNARMADLISAGNVSDSVAGGRPGDNQPRNIGRPCVCFLCSGFGCDCDGGHGVSNGARGPR